MEVIKRDRFSNQLKAAVALSRESVSRRQLGIASKPKTSPNNIRVLQQCELPSPMWLKLMIKFGTLLNMVSF